MTRLLAPVLLSTLLAGCAGLATPREPVVQHTLAEDDAVKIDELRVRGQVQRLQVTPKTAGAPAYDIVPDNRQSATTASGARDATGQRVWTLFSF
jgi:hypothetical protein